VALRTGQGRTHLSIPPAIPDTSSFDTGFHYYPLGVQYPVSIFQQTTEIAAGETLTLQWRMYAAWNSLDGTDGYPNGGGAETPQEIYTYYGSRANIYTWTKG
jgi:hypothetical protein